MRGLKFYIFSLILIFFSFSLIYSTTSCCYDSSSPKFAKDTSGICSDSTIVGSVDNDGTCNSYENTKLGCIDNSNKCTQTANGNYLFKIPALETLNFALKTTYCPGGLVDFKTDSRCTPQSSSGGNSGNSGQSGDSSSIGTPVINPPTSGEKGIISTTTNKKVSGCSNVAGGSFGFFVTKNSCETATDISLKTCLYNPNLGGLISGYSGFNNLNIWNLNPYEDSCISKSLIKTCKNYKTIDNCNNNRAGITDSCSWIYSSSFLQGSSLDKKTGICISNSTKSNKDFNKKFYGNRGNLVKNPSFENLKFWFNLNSLNIISSQNTFAGNKYYLLNKLGISQNISNLDIGKQYIPSIYIKYIDSNISISGLNLEIISYSDLGILSPIYSQDVKLKDLIDKNVGIFEKYTFKPFIISDKTKYIEFKLKSLNNDLIEIDAVNFIEEDKLDLTINQEIFNPLEIIPKKASNCNLCFENNNFNTCTKKKSNLLGDCEYLTTSFAKAYDLSSFLDPNLYLGNSNNKFMFKPSQKIPNENLKWTSQSLSKSQVFCELYVNKNQCEDTKNYINSNFKIFHPESGSTLCKWNLAAGCFKDSNNDNLTDTFTDKSGNNFPYISRFNKLEISNYENHKIFPITFDKKSFNKSCDILPPNSYIYFTGKNVNGSDAIITNFYNGIVGNLKLHLNIQDLNLESCNGFNLKKSLILDVGINSNYFATKFSTSQIKENLNMDSLFSGVDSFVNSLGKIFLISNYKEQFFNKGGENNFSLITIDQSGNVGKKFNFKFKNLDLNPPQINLTNYNYVIGDWISTSNLGRGILFNYSINDLTSFNCNFKLNPLGNVNPNFYINSGNFNSSNLTNGIFSFNISNYILNTSGNANNYDLNITCTDIFGQSSSKNSIFAVDFDTSISLVKPDLYLGDYSSPSGYLNDISNFVAVSSEVNLVNCNLIDFTDLNNGGNLNIINKPLGFNLDLYPGVLFLNNITGILDFASEGIKNGAIKCTDNLGNVFKKNLSYLYDKTNPILKDFSIVDKINTFDNSNSIYFNGSNYFTINDLKDIKLNLTFNGTGSWIDNIYNLSGWNQTNIWLYLKNIPFNLISSSFSENGISNLVIGNFDNILTYQGIPQLDKNLYLKKFSFNFSDRAKNKNSAYVNYYYDSSNPKLIFSGDVISQDDDLGEIYTSKSNPQINLSFNSPTYRKYICTIIGKDKSGFSQFEFLKQSNNFIFNLSKIFNYNVDVEKDGISLDVSCSDIYKKKLKGNFKLIFDNKVPILNDVNFDLSSNKIFKTRSLNKIFPDIIDKLVFDLTDTNEISYKCNYNFATVDDTFYFCNTSSISSEFYSSGIQKTNNLVILEGTNSNNKTICFRSSKFNNNLQTKSININKSLNTKITMSAYCMDRVGLKTKVITKDLNIIYTPNDFISFDFNYKNRKAYPVVKSFVNYDEIKISTDRLAQFGIYETLSNPIEVGGNEMKVYEYKSTKGFSLDNFKDGTTIMYAVSLNSSSFITSNLIVDNTNPTGNIVISDENDGVVFTNNFWVQLNGEDFNGGLNKIDLLLNGINIFSYDGLNVSYDKKIVNLDNSKSIAFENSNTLFSQFIELKNMSFNTNYTLTLKVYDRVNNLNQSSKYISIIDGVGLILTNSINSKVDPSRRLWVTSSVAPIISFNTTKLVTQCSIDAMDNKAWKLKGVKIPTQKILSNGGNLINSFSLDLSTLANFDLSQLDFKVNQINISCLDSNKSKYNYVRELRYIDYLPDYVLTSLNGFVLNEEPYTTSINVKSVGPYRYINCKYDDGKNGFINFNQKNTTSFYSNLDYSDAIFGTGVYNLKLQCSDVLGNTGPIKIYPISINKNLGLKILDIGVLNFKGFKSLPVLNVGSNDGTIYVNTLNNLNVEFKLNKKNNVDCSYNTNSNSFFGFISAIKNLFSIGIKKITSSENPFVYTLDKFNLNSNSEILNIRCSVLGTGDEVRKTYNIEYLNNSNSVFSWI